MLPRLTSRIRVWCFRLMVVAYPIANVSAQNVLIADFERFSEGFIGPSFVDGGLTFSDLDLGFPIPPPGPSFSADWAPTGQLPAPFSTGNVLAFSSYGVGGAVSLNRFT